MIRSAKNQPATGGMAGELAQSDIYRDYEQAFKEASGLPLVLKTPFDDSSGQSSLSSGSKFCELMAKKHPMCMECLEFQKRLECDAKAGPSTMKCFAGLCESAIPVRVGKGIVAFLTTGHVFLDKPDHASFSRLARRLMDWGAEIDLKRAEEAWLSTRVLKPGQYQAFVKMLQVFARHLEASCGELVMKPKEIDPPAIRQAREFITGNSGDRITLGKVARVVNLSAHHLCKKFKQCTGVSFIEYVSRVRVEKARLLLLAPACRVNEVCFQAGFSSLSQFNRAFKKQTGCSPREYRQKKF